MIEGSIVVQHAFWGNEWKPIRDEELVQKRIPKIFELARKYPDSRLFFYGSRSMEYIPIDNTGSDWDFAVDKNDRIVKYLVEEGFVPSDTGYYDAWSIQVLNYKDGEHTIQISIRSNLNAFQDVWEALPTYFWNTYINKRSAKYLGKEGCAAFFNCANTLAHEPYDVASRNLAEYF